MNWNRLGSAVRARRQQLGLTQDDVAAAGGPSTATVRLIEAGNTTSFRPATLRTLEHALRWPRGRCDELLGRGPVAQQVGDVSVASISGLSEEDLEVIASKILEALPTSTVGRIVQQRLSSD